MITIENLTVSYGSKNVLSNLNLNLELGKIHGIIGLNGAGKTTLLNTIYGIIKGKNGSIRIEDTRMNRKNIAYLEAENFFYSHITGLEYLQLFNTSNIEFNIENWNRLFTIPLEELVENYSTGMKKKLALMAVFKLDKPVIILDEPFNGIDLETSYTLMLLLEKQREKGKTILITSHILESLTKVCDKIHYLNNKVIELTFNSDEFDILEKKVFGDIEKRNNEFIDNL